MKLFEIISNLLRKKEEKKDVNLEDLALKEIKSIKRKKYDSNSLNELIYVIKVYIENKYSIKNNLTFEEITIKLNKKKIDREINERLNLIFKSLNEIEFADKKTDKKSFRGIINDFMQVLLINKQVQKIPK